MIKLHCCSLATIASSKALTQREWDTLARVLGELEAMTAIRSSPGEPGTLASDGIGSRIAEVHRAFDELAARIEATVRDEFARNGLAVQEFFLRVTPRVTYETMNQIYDRFTLDDETPGRKWPDTEWDVTVRLFPRASQAKSNATDTGGHAPTLSEQFGRR